MDGHTSSHRHYGHLARLQRVAAQLAHRKIHGFHFTSIQRFAQQTDLVRTRFTVCLVGQEHAGCDPNLAMQVFEGGFLHEDFTTIQTSQ